MTEDDITADRVELLSDGTFTIDGGMLVYGVPKFYGKPYKARLKPLYIESGDERILVDTGAGEPPEKWAKMYGIDKEMNLPQSLKKMDLSPEDITMVLNTHLHFDHTGYNRLFTNAKHIASEDEIRYSAYPDRFQAGGYLKENLEGIRWKGIIGETEVAPGVTMIPTPGHTPGHMSVLVELEKEVVVYTGDVSPLPVNHEKKLIVGILYSPVDALDSLELLDTISNWWPEKPKRFIYSHD
jgi:glyoxylase-like metal-dependent hydrolase (beta-lactamase superfamily II)